MRHRFLIAAPLFAIVFGCFSVSAADAQILKRLKDGAKNAATQQMMREVEELVAKAVRCAFNDMECIRSAEEAGEEVVLTDPDGEILYDDDGRPYQDPEELPPELVESMPAATPVPQPSASTSFDFEPGERVIFYDDYAGDNLGDFPRNLTFLSGNWELVEWQDRRLLQNTGPRSASFRVDLPEALPEMFTIEFDVYFPHGNQQMLVATTAPAQGSNWATLEGNLFRVASSQMAGLTSGPAGEGVESVNRAPAVAEGLVPFRIMADGNHVKVFVGEQRVANVPNADIRRSEALYFENTYFADAENPMFVGPIRVAAGGRDLYDALEADGRVAVRDILFDTGKSDIRPESAARLAEMGTMLQEHPDLSLLIEGHTDDQGGFDTNMTLSNDRAAAVKQYLVDNFEIDPERLRSMGLGQTQPVDTNDTPEGRQKNRRVELVKM